MKLIACGAGVTVAGLACLLLMVMRVIEPGLAGALLAYSGAFAGMLLALAGAVRVGVHRPSVHDRPPFEP